MTLVSLVFGLISVLQYLLELELAWLLVCDCSSDWLIESTRAELFAQRVLSNSNSN